jgi:hypothetical protein
VNSAFGRARGGERVDAGALVILPLATLAQFASGVGYGLATPAGSTAGWWAGLLMTASATMAAACAILAVTFLGAPAPSSCAPLSPAGAGGVSAGLSASLLALGVLSVYAARLAARDRRGGTLVAVLMGEALAAALAVALFAALAGGTSC